MLDIANETWYYVDSYLPRPILSYVTPRNELRTVPTKSLSISAIGKQARMKSKPGSSKRQDRNFEIVVNHITTNEDQLPQVSRQSMAALQDVLGHNVKKYSGTFHKPGNEHVHFLVMSKAPNTKSAVKARIGASMALIFGTEAGSVDVAVLEIWEISHGSARNGSGRQGPVQVAIAASKAGTPEWQCKTYEDFERLLEAAAESVGGTKCTLPKLPGFFSTVPKRVKGNFVPKVFKALPKQEQTSKRQRTMKYLQGPDGQSLKEEVVVQHNFLEGHPPDF
eukprot:jgi/Astpho2/8544/Aster-05578